MRSVRFPAVRFLFGPVAAIGVLALGALGCAGRGDVSGKVTFENKPVVFGTVLIEASDGNAFQANVEKDGSYSVRGVPTGQARVAVNSPNPRSITLVAKRNRVPEPYPDVPGWFPIPGRYEKPGTSGLTYTINRGSNTIDIELKK